MRAFLCLNSFTVFFAYCTHLSVFGETTNVLNIHRKTPLPNFLNSNLYTLTLIQLNVKITENSIIHFSFIVVSVFIHRESRSSKID